VKPIFLDPACWKTDALGVVVCGALIGAAYFGGLGPLALRRAEAGAQRDELLRREREAADAAGTVESLRARVRAANERLDAASVKLEPIDAANRRVATLTTKAAEKGLVIGEVSMGDPEAFPRFSVVRIHLRGTGSYPACAAFLHDVNNDHPDMKVTSLELVASEKGADGSREAGFSIEFAWYAEPMGAPRPAASK